jgi:hydrogenase maturation protease
VSTVVIGLGNPYRGDDAVGLAVTASLEGRVPAGVELVACEQEPSRLIDVWAAASAALVVDAVASGAAPGTVHRFDASAAAIPAGVFRSSTHSFGVGDAIELARALGKLPPNVVVYGVEVGDVAAGVALTAPVEAAVEPVANAVLEDLEHLIAKEEEPCTNGH